MTGALRNFTVAIVCLCVTGTVLADKPGDKSSSSASEYRWEDEAAREKLSDKEIELLRKNKFVIGESYRQIFAPYLGGKVPLFITSDSMLNGFHVLLEESIYRMERAQAAKLPATLETIWKNLDQAEKQYKSDDKLFDAARQRARIFLTVARNLLDEKALPDDDDLRKIVKEEVQRIVTAEGVKMPAWLGPPDEGFLAIDYTRFKPRSFYTKTPTLERYFRAVSWLQAIPFRVDKDEEFAAFFLLRRAYHDPDKDKPAVDESWWSAYRVFLGTFDDWDISQASHLPKTMTKDGLAEVRKDYPKDFDIEVNDLLSSKGKPERNFRFVSAHRLLDGAMFQHTMELPLDRKLPTGLEVAALLNSPFARERIKKDSPELLDTVDDCRALLKQRSLYSDYLESLRVLAERTEPDAPELFHSDAWKRKTCQTALAGWAQIRHTWALQAKQGVSYICGLQVPSGFVEPVPEFYAGFTELMELTVRELDAAGALARVDDSKELKADLEKGKAIVARLRKDKKDLSTLTDEEKSMLTQFDPDLNSLGAKADKKELEDALTGLEQMLGFAVDYGLNEDTAPSPNPRLKQKWNDLIHIGRRLEIMSHKQLRRVDFSREEEEFIKEYGKNLARIMFYDGNSYINPRDDAPRIVDVLSNMNVQSKYLEVGIGRPQELWLLYPVKGVDTLCRGAVLSYYEFPHGERLTDAAWKTLLDSDKRPDRPAWTNGIIAPKGSAERKE